MSQSHTQPDFASIALITIDMQTDFLKGEACEIPGTSDVLEPIAAVCGVFRNHGLPIIHVVRLYERDGTNVDLCRRAALEQGAAIVLTGSRGSELAPLLRPCSDTRLNTEVLLSGGLQELGPKEWAMYKPRWGAFYQTPLQEHLTALGVGTLGV